MSVLPGKQRQEQIMTAGLMKRSEASGVPWWMVLIEGIALLILGVLLISNPTMTTLILIQFVGLYWLIAGIFKIISIFMDSSMWGWKLVGGIIGIIAGILVLQHPLWSPFVVGGSLVIILGIQGIIIGIVGLVQAFQGAGWGAAVLGVISIIIGILFLGNVWAFTFSLPLAIAILALIGGVTSIVAAFKLK